MHILILNGYYESNSRIVGLALDATTFVVFPRYMEPWEAAIIVGHELGHLLGLVGALGLEDQYTPPGAGSHYDIEEPKHCTDARCMMSYTVDTVKTYCDKCEADLALRQGEPIPLYHRGGRPKGGLDRLRSVFDTDRERVGDRICGHGGTGPEPQFADGQKGDRSQNIVKITSEME